ncbi:hypothetical protein AAES_70223 [Amazona aestiva]|uniref:Peroxisomal membrane protein 11C n=1 Tax=Amazona aestiva TaxID=12930 RepID=A0A0Q3MJ71_AMAAE|nr:hypothetical protein AAES_70223 [Amazona aestiva]
MAASALSGLVAALETHRGRDRADEDGLVRALSVLCNMANQLYYPCEHIAWAADAGIIRTRAQKWWTLSTGLWALSLLLGILR